jgi:hypothetical protein
MVGVSHRCEWLAGPCARVPVDGAHAELRLSLSHFLLPRSAIDHGNAPQRAADLVE